MAIQIISAEKQVQGNFDNGKILERKPIGFPHEGGITKSYSTLFYWAYAWSEKGGLIDEHPHKGFEIMSYVLRGEIEHYDSQLKGWKKLKAGDAQIIRAGNGITHAEKILSDSAIFQIWFDPNLNKTLSQKATYNDYVSESFPVFIDKESSAKIIVGGTDFKMESKIDYIQEITFFVNEKKFHASSESVYSFFLLEGNLEMNGNKMQKNDFAILKEETQMKFSNIQVNSKIFLIKSPLKLDFKTYSEMM